MGSVGVCIFETPWVVSFPASHFSSSNLFFPFSILITFHPMSFPRNIVAPFAVVSSSSKLAKGLYWRAICRTKPLTVHWVTFGPTTRPNLYRQSSLSAVQKWLGDHTLSTLIDKQNDFGKEILVFYTDVIVLQACIFNPQGVVVTGPIQVLREAILWLLRSGANSAPVDRSSRYLVVLRESLLLCKFLVDISKLGILFKFCDLPYSRYIVLHWLYGQDAANDGFCCHDDDDDDYIHVVGRDLRRSCRSGTDCRHLEPPYMHAWPNPELRAIRQLLQRGLFFRRSSHV